MGLVQTAEQERRADREQQIATILAPAIDARAPYARVMIGMIADLLMEREDAVSKAVRGIEKTLPRELMIVSDPEGNFAVAKR